MNHQGLGVPLCLFDVLDEDFLRSFRQSAARTLWRWVSLRTRPEGALARLGGLTALWVVLQLDGLIVMVDEKLPPSASAPRATWFGIRW